MIVGIDASRNRSGGARVHLVGMLTAADPRDFGISQVHVWSYAGLLRALPDAPWVVKHNPPAVEGSLARQIWWQYSTLPGEARRAGCQVLLNTDAGTVCPYRPGVTMSRDMLSYEGRERHRYGLSRARLRLWALRTVQARSLARADGTIFLTRYASRVIQEYTGSLDHVAVIPHGVGDQFRADAARRPTRSPGRPQNVLYVSNTALYKHQWNVVRAIADLRRKGHAVRLTLAGGGSGKAERLLQQAIREEDPHSEFVTCIGAVRHEDIPNLHRDADLFVFASSCENMPNTLVEAMAAGLPIACSDRGPMPEVLGDGGVYFDPEQWPTISKAIESLLVDDARRQQLAERARVLSQSFSWARCARETWTFLRKVAQVDVDLPSRGRTAGSEPAAETNLMARDNYRICSNCVMDTTDARITFDERGVCDHCREFYAQIQPNWHTDARGRAELNRQVDRIKAAGAGKDFDCIIGMSGGIDSSYLTYLAKVELGLRPLVFHVDAGWNSQEAVNNIERIVDALGLDLFTVVIDWEEMRDLQLAFFKSGVPHIDTPQDHAFFATMYTFAEKHGVNHILTGANYSTECIRNPLEWMYYQSDSVQLRDIHRKHGTKPLRSFPITSILRHKVWLRYVKRIQVLRPLNYMPYIKAEAMALLESRFGWQPYPQKHFESRFTKFYESYWLPTKFGYDVRRVQYSSLILTGQMTRAEALERLEKPPFDTATIGRELEYVAAKLQISVEELKGYLDAPNRTFRDYKSQHRIYDIGAKAMRMLGLELGGKR